MKLGWLIFILAFFVRLFNLLFLDLNVDNYLVEDQKFYWNWSLKGAYLPWNEVPFILLTERIRLYNFIHEICGKYTHGMCSVVNSRLYRR